MSRIGRLPIPVPSGVDVAIDGLFDAAVCVGLHGLALDHAGDGVEALTVRRR